MATVEDRKKAQQGHVPTLLRLIAEDEISSIGDDYWYIYDDTTPQGYRLPDVDWLIERGLAMPKGYYEIHLTEAGRSSLPEQPQPITDTQYAEEFKRIGESEAEILAEELSSHTPPVSSHTWEKDGTDGQHEDGAR